MPSDSAWEGHAIPGQNERCHVLTQHIFRNNDGPLGSLVSHKMPRSTYVVLRDLCKGTGSYDMVTRGEGKDWIGLYQRDAS